MEFYLIPTLVGRMQTGLFGLKFSLRMHASGNQGFTSLDIRHLLMILNLESKTQLNMFLGV